MYAELPDSYIVLEMENYIRAQLSGKKVFFDRQNPVFLDARPFTLQNTFRVSRVLKPPSSSIARRGTVCLLYHFVKPEESQNERTHSISES